jgi:prepilin-type N-terminal cleavage/methylation domain-containing protein
MRRAHRTDRRGGFTLIELIVVILIILILMGLIGAGVLKYMDLAPQLQTTNELTQLTNACEAFKLKYKMYPPSSFLVSNTFSDYSGTGYDTIMLAIWPRITSGFTAGTISWAPVGTKILLEGDQCLVFFLGGPNQTGWSTDPTNPTSSGGTRNGPFFEFPTTRLVTFAHQTGNATFPSFADPYSLPTKSGVYAFFSSGRTTNGYNTGTLTGATNTGDCPSLPGAPQPYVQSTGRFYNPNSIQIISAGKDQKFGGGGSWVPGGYAAGTVGFDDLSNFASGFLGVP